MLHCLNNNRLVFKFFIRPPHIIYKEFTSIIIQKSTVEIKIKPYILMCPEGDSILHPNNAVWSNKYTAAAGYWLVLANTGRIKKRPSDDERFFFGGSGGIRTHEPLRTTAFRVFYSQHTLADFEKKCPILRVNALVRKKMIFSSLRLFPTVRNARELSERTNRTAIKHNNRKSP